MSSFATMQVGTLKLRKTDEGWQYLSEGTQSEPDRWCDAATSLGPFSNSGVGSLLDELLAARELATFRAESAILNNGTTSAPAIPDQDAENAIMTLRLKGYAVVAFSPEQLGPMSVEEMVPFLEKMGAEAIEELAEEEEEEE